MSFTIEVGGMTASYAGAASLSPQRLEILLALAGGLSVIDRVQTGPPRRPGVGYRYIVASPAEDEWAGQEGRVAVWVGDAWAFLNPADGLQAWDEDAAETIQYSSSAWAASGGGGGGAPTTAEYVVKTANGSLSSERVVTDTPSIAADWATPGQVKFSAVWTEAEIDFGSTPVWGGEFTVVDANVSGSSKVAVVPSGNAPTGLTSDEWTCDLITFAAKGGSGQFTLYAAAHPGPVSGKRKILYQVT